MRSGFGQVSGIQSSERRNASAQWTKHCSTCTRHRVVERCDRATALAQTKGDDRTRELRERHLAAEEESVDWLESQLHVIREIGRERFLAEKLEGRARRAAARGFRLALRGS